MHQPPMSSIRALLQAIGGFDGTGMVGDTLMSWEYTIGHSAHLHARRRGRAPSPLRRFALRERRARGREFAQVRRSYFRLVGATHAFRPPDALMLRLLKLTARTLRHGWRASPGCGRGGRYPSSSLPTARLAGEAEG
ncbi:MAG: hypothetical protein R3A10_02190 [Caldilineaceae bacterium]